MNQRFYLLKRQLLGIEPAIRRRFVDKIPPLVTGQISKPERGRMKKVFADSELEEGSTIRNFRIAALAGKSYNTKHYNLSAICQDKAILL